MENRNLEKALDIISSMLMGEKVGSEGSNASLYDEYSHNSEVYDILMRILKKLDLKLYEYNNTLFISAGSTNRVFGFTNEELKRLTGVRLNKELYMLYYITYCMITEFYRDSSTSTYLEYLRIEEVIKSVDSSLLGRIDNTVGLAIEEAEADSFKALALLWDELPAVSQDDKNGTRAAKNSKSGYVKLTFNFLLSQNLFTQVGDCYYPTDRFRGIAEEYFEDNRSRLYEILNGNKEDENATD